MTFYFRTIQIGTPKQPGEGIRIGTVRYLPRGIRKDAYSEQNLFDVWLSTLAPSRELLEVHDKGLSVPLIRAARQPAEASISSSEESSLP